MNPASQKIDTEGYEEYVTEPVDMHSIRECLKNGLYEDGVALKMKVALIFENCMAFNQPRSAEYKAAAALWKVLKPL